MNEVFINVISIVIIALTICFFLVAVLMNFKEDNKLKLVGKIIRFTKENSKYKTFAYIVYPFIVLFILFFISYYNNFYDNGEIDYFFSAIYSLIATVKSLVFETDLAPIETLFKELLAYRIAWLVAYPYALIFVYATIINTFSDSLKNKVVVKSKLKKSCDIVIGLKDLKTYSEGSENLIAWVEPNISKEDLELIKSYKIPYIKMPFTVENLNRIKFNLKEDNEYHFITFNEESYNLHILSIFNKFISQKNKEGFKYESKAFFVHIEISEDNLNTIQEKILKEQKDISSYINLFNRNKLIAQKFIEDNPITKYMFNLLDFEKCAIINENEDGFSKDINVIYLGFNRLSRELFKAAIMNDQIPSYNVKRQQLENHIINYYAFDKSLSDIDKNEMFYEKRYSYYEKDILEKEYFEKPQKICNFIEKENDPFSKEFYAEFVEILKTKKEQYNSIVISFKDDLSNIDYALKLIKLFKELNINSYHIFVKVDEYNEETFDLLKDEHITFFGWKESVINHEIIVREDLLTIAKLTNENYSSKRLIDTNWYKLDPIKQKSNLYSSLNLRLKLNLLGYDYKKVDEEVDNSELLNELVKKIKFDINKYEDYLFFENNRKPVCAQVLAYQEHSRWNAFYIAQGYLPYRKEDIVLLDEANCVFKKEDNVKRYHACLTTYKGLNEYHHLLAKLLSEKNNKSIDENILKVETYKYDFNLLDSFTKIFSSKYLLVKLK